jgi:GNAT superfamily N-acetyltransferase
MEISSRSYNHNTDFNTVRNFIAETFFQSPSYQFWIPSRFENSIFHENDKNNRVHLWWDENCLAGVVVFESPNNFFIFQHNNYTYLYPIMIQWAEEFCTQESNLSEMEIYTYSLKDDLNSIFELERRGYQFVNESEHNQLRKISDPLPDISIPNGFSIKQIKPENYDQFVKAVEKIFKHSLFTHEVFAAMRTTKFFKDDLLLGVFTEKGTLAAFAQQRIDEYKIIEFEPVGTLPEYRRNGLAKALMRESFIRAEKYNPKIFYVGGAATEEADRLYGSVGFTDMKIVTRWSKKIKR